MPLFCNIEILLHFWVNDSLITGRQILLNVKFGDISLIILFQNIYFPGKLSHMKKYLINFIQFYDNRKSQYIIGSQT